MTKKTTINRAIIAILAFSLIMPALYAIQPASAYTNSYGTIEYWAGGNQINITGNSSDGDAWKFYDFWYWANIDPGTYPDIVVSPDSNATHEGTQYYFTCKLQIGDGSTETWFKDTNKQVTFADGLISANRGAITSIKNNAVFQLGNLIDETDKITNGGCSIFTNEATYIPKLFSCSDGSTIYLYSTQIKANGKGILNTYKGGRMWNCKLENAGIDPLSNIDIFNVIGEDFSYSVIYHGFAGSIERFTILKGVRPFYLASTYSLTARDVYARDFSYVAAIESGWSGNAYLIDADIDNWVFSWLGAETGKIYRQYTFNPIITYVNGSSVAHAHVILKDRYNNTIIDDYTDSDGRILNGTEPYVVTSAFYNQTGGNTPYLQSPHHLTITKAGYATYETNITIDHPVIDDAFVLDSLTYTYDDIMNYLQQKWGSYNASQFWNYINQIDANLTDVYNLLQLTDGNLTDVMNLLQSPFAQYTYDIQGCNIRFHENAFDWNGYITNYTWDFGDGNISYEQNPLHSYNSVGYYNVTLTVTDNESKSSNVTHMINVTSACPFPPLLVSPKNNSNDVDKDVLLSVYVYDPSDNPMTVTFYQYNATGNDTVIGTCNGISGQEASIIWKDRTVGQTYQWYAIASDGTHNATSGIFSFTVSETQINVPQTAFYGGLILFIGMAAIGEYAYRKSEKKTTILFALVALVSFLNVYLVWNWKWMVTFYILTTLLYSLRWAFSRVSGGEL
ncbi:MAG: PKD domain-containing protein [Deltaproteobacteria bacterium]|nr:PKD domain-containing protein [Deltaproteobacteria bacterium]